MNATLRMIGRLASVVVALAAQGCGTILTVSNWDRQGSKHALVYSGVRFDYSCAFDEERLQHALILKPFCVLDMPMSFAGDTLVLPYTAIKGKYSDSPPPANHHDSSP